MGHLENHGLILDGNEEKLKGFLQKWCREVSLITGSPWRLASHPVPLPGSVGEEKVRDHDRNFFPSVQLTANGQKLQGQSRRWRDGCP
jgi:hypothetical protein